MTDDALISSGKQSFVPKARLVSVLGEQLIRDARVGLLELVKNAYDADATKVIIQLHGLMRPETTVIIIEDDGTGMDKETVLGKWLEPATGHKEDAKAQGIRTPRFNRLPLGEKGVGRFAAQRLGRKLELVTRKRGAAEIVLKVDWDDFEKAESYLHEVKVDWEERVPQVFTGDTAGTRLIMRMARSAWSDNDVRVVSEGLKRLMSPFRPVNDFQIELLVPDYPKYEDLDPGDLLKSAHAVFQGLVDSDGIMDAEYVFQVPGFPEHKQEFTSEDLRAYDPEWIPVTRRPLCGGFYFYFYLWHRTEGVLRLTGASRKDLDKQCGVNIFRDGMRVLPYGEEDDDWLSLDQRRYMQPGEAIGRKAILASIEITQEENKALHDKTNREGLIENRAFLDLRGLVLALVKVVENEWKKDRDVIEGRKREKREVAARPALEKLQAELVNLQSFSGLTQAAIERVSNALAKGKADPNTILELSNALSQLRTAIPVVEATASNSQDQLEQTVSDLEDQRDLLLGLAGIGLAAERFTHEFARLTREASDLIKRIQSNELPPKAYSDINALSAIIDALRNDIKALGPMFYVRRATREKELSILAAINNARILNQRSFDEAKVDFSFSGDDFTVVMREGPLTQVFNNLFDNATFWLSRKSDENNRRLRVLIDSPRQEVVVSDNGPGINPRYVSRVFEPFFTTKTDGRGLGLYIIREILAEKKFGIRLLEPDELRIGKFTTGAAFLLTFRDLSEEDNEHVA